MLMENGVSVCSDFGSTASEFGVCLRSVGIADRAGLVKLALHGEPERVAGAVEQAVGIVASPPLASFADGAWWYPLADDRTIVLCEPGDRAWVEAMLDEVTVGVDGVRWSDVSDEWEALAIVGPGSDELLHGACAGEADELPDGGCRGVHIATTVALMLHEAPARFLALVPRAEAVAAWGALSTAGEKLGVAWVGRLALDSLAITTRTRTGQGAG